jgi:hypothetical protein
MLKEKLTKAYRVYNFVIEFDESVFSTDNCILICKICNVKVTSEKHFTITQHLKTDKQIISKTSVENKNTNNVQQLITNCNPKLSKFSLDLCKTTICK